MQLNLKTKITAFMLLLFIGGIWTLTYIISVRLEKEMTAQLEEQQFSIASYIADNIEGQVNLRMRALNAIAGGITPDLISRPAKLQEFLRNKFLLPMLFQTGCVVISKEGIGIADYPVLPGRAGASYSELEYFKDVLATGREAVGKPRIGRFSQQPVVGFAVPVRSSQGQLIAVLVGFTLTSDSSLLGSIEHAAYKNFPDRLLLASPKYQIMVAASDPTRVLTPTPKTGVNPLFDRFMSGFEGSGITVNARGIKILLSARQIPTPGWFIRVGLPAEIAFAPVRSMKRMAFAMAIGLSLIISLLVWFIIREMLRPLFTASKLITDLTGGQLPPQDIPVTRHDEIGLLISSFNTHLNHRKRMEEDLERYRALLRALSYEMAALENREQRRIAQELHDSIPQTLAFCKMRLEAIEQSCASLSSCSGSFQEIYGFLDNSIAEARSLIFKLAPPVLYELGLEPAIQQLLRQFGKAHPIDFRFEGWEHGPSMKGEHAAIVYSMVRELITNCVKHAGANMVQVSVSRHEGDLIIQVRDNGKGFDPEKAAHRMMMAEAGGFGLFSIRERMRYMEGVFTIESSEGNGACATICVPLLWAKKAAQERKQTQEES